MTYCDISQASDTSTPPAPTAHARQPRQLLSQALAEAMREKLTANGWSQRTFAEKLGMTQGAVSYLLRNKRRADGLDYYEKLAEIFGVTLSELCRELEVRVADRRRRVFMSFSPPLPLSREESQMPESQMLPPSPRRLAGELDADPPLDLDPALVARIDAILQHAFGEILPALRNALVHGTPVTGGTSAPTSDARPAVDVGGADRLAPDHGQAPAADAPRSGRRRRRPAQPRSIAR